MGKDKDTWKGNIEKLETKKDCIKWKYPSTKIDGNVAFLHYRVSSILLIAISGLLTVKQFYGEAIQCTSEQGNEDLDEMAGWYCLIHSTYTVPKSNLDASAHPGVAPVRLAANGGGDVIHHRYYLWVHTFLFILGILFYFPKFFWKSLEEGKMRMLTRKLTEQGELKRFGSGDKKKVSAIATYFVANKGYHLSYFCSYLTAELLYLLNVITQVVLIDKLLGNELSVYGLEVLGFSEQDPEVRVDGIERIFPKVTKCNFDKYGPSGNIVHHDFICLLPLNIINEKIFIWIWYWMIVLIVVTFHSIGTWILFLLSPSFRLKILIPRNTYTHIRARFNYEFSLADLFFINQLKSNLKPLLYDFLLLQIVHKLEEAEAKRLNTIQPCHPTKAATSSHNSPTFHHV